MKKPDHQITFRIDGFTPNTLPMARIAQYLKLLSDLYGNKDQVHFKQVSKGSAALDMFCDSSEVCNSIYEKNTALANGIGNVVDLKTYNKINDLLREDNTYAETIMVDSLAQPPIEFPGIKEPKPADFQPMTQHGSLQGEIVLVGGTDSTIPVWLRDPAGKVQKNVSVGKSLAKELAQLIFTSVRLNGVGSWVRTADHEWVLKSFTAQSFEMLSDESLLDVVTKTRMISSEEWDSVDNLYDELRKLRD